LIAVLALTFGRIGVKTTYADSFNVGDAAALIAAINTANSNA